MGYLSVPSAVEQACASAGRATAAPNPGDTARQLSVKGRRLGIGWFRKKAGFKRANNNEVITE